MTDLLPQASGSASNFETRKGRSSAARSKSQSQGSKDWTIKGLPSQTVDVAREAARESGMKINAWVAGVFEQAAAGELPSPTRIAKPVVDAHFFDSDNEIHRLRLRNEELVQTVHNLSRALLKMG